MNCAQHTDTAAVAYCCNCGKALCAACRRDVQGAIFCEPCLAARSRSAAGNAGGSYRPLEDASPELALFLGFIPGVGAFYNGQFLKGFVHVIVLCMLIFLSDHGMRSLAGLMIAAWFFYMVFDAYTTAKARRYGLPIPDLIGLNAILEGRNGAVRQNASPRDATPGNPAPGDAASNANQTTTPNLSFPPQNTGTYDAAPSYAPLRERERSPVGALVLIGLGVLFLLSNLGWFSLFWIKNYWPVILIAAGVWLFIQRQRGAR